MSRKAQYELRRLITVAVVVLAASVYFNGEVYAQQAAGRSVASVARVASPTVVTIHTATSTGSAVVVDASGVLVTALHVVRGSTTASVKLPNGDVYDDISVVDVDERRDIVLLKIKAFGLIPAKLGNSESVQVGDLAVVAGSPQGLEQTVSSGIISAIRDFGEGFHLFQTDAAVSPGNSGGGLFNESGELVAN